MLVAFDKLPLHNANKFRGIGTYTHCLMKQFADNSHGHSFFFFEKKSEIPKNADIIHYPYFDLFFTSLPFSNSEKTVVTVHDLIPLKFPQHFPRGIKGSLKWLRQKSALRRVAHIITDSQSSKEDIVSLIGIPNEKISVVYLASQEYFRRLEVQKVTPILKRFKVTSKYLLYVGDINYNKNVEGLVRAFAKIKSGYQLVIVSKALLDSNLREARNIGDLITSLQLENRINILGFIRERELAALFSGSSLYVQPSFYEGFGLPLLNAMSCGAIAVASKMSSLPEVGGDSIDYFDPYNIDEMVGVIEENLDLSDEELEERREKIVNQAKLFSWQKTANQTIKIYERVFQKL